MLLPLTVAINLSRPMCLLTIRATHRLLLRHSLMPHSCQLHMTPIAHQDIVGPPKDIAAFVYDVYAPLEPNKGSKVVRNCTLLSEMYGSSGQTGYGLATFNLSHSTGVDGPEGVAYGHLGMQLHKCTIIAMRKCAVQSSDWKFRIFVAYTCMCLQAPLMGTRALLLTFLL